MPNVGPYIYDVSISGFTRSSIYIYEISSLRVNATVSDLDYVTLNDRMPEFSCLSLDLCVPSHCGVEVIVARDHTQTHHTR